MKADIHLHHFVKHPDPVGYWQLGSFTYLAIYGDVPTPEQIRNTEQQFGWKWKPHPLP